MISDLFADPKQSIQLAPGAVLLEGFALPEEAEILAAINGVIKASLLRHMITPNGYGMSVAMTNCGAAGWVSDRKGYRYERNDPQTGKPWPEIPGVLMKLAQKAASEAGYHDYVPDVCLINSYVPGAKLSLHQDNDEVDFSAPHCFRIAGLAGDLSVWRPDAPGKTAKNSSAAWRRLRIRWPVTHGIPRHRAA